MPEKPANFIIDVQRGNPWLKWDAQTDCDGYEIDRLLEGDKAPTLRAGFNPWVKLDGSATSWVDSKYDELAPSCRRYGGLIRYRIRAINGNERSEWAEASVTITGTAYVLPTMPDVIAYVCARDAGTVSRVLLRGDGTAEILASADVARAAVAARYGDYLVVADYRDMLSGTLTVLDRNTLALVGSVTGVALAYATSVVMVGNLACVTSQTYGDGISQGAGTIAVVDLFDVKNPKIVGIATPNQTYLSHPFATAQWNDYVFVSGNSNQRLCIVDCSNRYVPRYIAAHQVKYVGEGHTALALSYPWLFCSHDCGSIVCYDVTNPIDPRCVGQIGDEKMLKNISNMRLSLNTLHCASVTGYYLQIDVSDPTCPKIVGIDYLGGSSLWDIQIVGNNVWAVGDYNIFSVNRTTGNQGGAFSSAFAGANALII